MSASQNHYEVFIKRNRKAAWTLVSACETKEEAIELAQKLVKETPKASLRVSKEKYEAEHGAFRSYTIFEVGDKFQDDDRADRTADLPCRAPGDLCSPHARETIGRALKEWLKRNLVTPLELLHRVDLVEKLEASGTEYQHAVQKVAIASASSQSANVQHFIKQINDLLKRATEALYAAHRADAFPKLKPSSLAETASALTGKANKDFLFRGAVATCLKSPESWKGKFERALDLADAALALDAATTDWTLDVIGEFVADFIAVDEARNALLADVSELGDELDAFTDMIRKPEGRALSKLGRRLATHFHGDRFIDSQRAVARHIVAGLMTPRRLKPRDIRGEIKLNRSIADRLIQKAGVLVSQDALFEAFVFRSGRLLDGDAIGAFLAPAHTIAEEVLDLVELEDNLVGDANKAKLAGYIRAALSGHSAENHFIKSSEPPTRRLAELAAVRAKLDDAAFAAEDVDDIFVKIDAFAVAIENKVKLFNQITSRAASPLDAAATYLRLIDKGVLPAGRLADEARSRAMRLLASPDVKALVTEGDPTNVGLAREVAAMLATVQAVAPASSEPSAA